MSVFKGNLQLPNDSKQNAVMVNGHVIAFSADCDFIRELLFSQGIASSDSTSAD